jgi:Arf-GAP with coiled-coil, ANK repeat and PH domain-containing protein
MLAGHTAQVLLMLKHNADQNIKDADGQEPVTIAVQTANADIVTL